MIKQSGSQDVLHTPKLAILRPGKGNSITGFGVFGDLAAQSINGFGVFGDLAAQSINGFGVFGDIQGQSINGGGTL